MKMGNYTSLLTTCQQILFLWKRGFLSYCSIFMLRVSKLWIWWKPIEKATGCCEPWVLTDNDTCWDAVLSGNRISSGFRGGEESGRPPPLRDSTPCRPNGSPLCTILRYPFLVTDPKKFLKAPLYSNFEGEARAKKRIFWSKLSKKCL